MADEPIVFLASFPPIQSAIKIGQDGARIQLDVPETEIEAVQALLAMRGKVLIVTMQEERHGAEAEDRSETSSRSHSRSSRG